MTFITVILISLACIAISYFVYLDYRRRQMINAFPGPKSFPLIGNAYHFLLRSIDGNNEKIIMHLIYKKNKEKVLRIHNRSLVFLLVGDTGSTVELRHR